MGNTYRKYILRAVVSSYFFSIIGGHAAELLTHINQDEPLAPWFTGPLLCSSGNVVEPGHINVQPYYYSIINSGTYNKNWKYVPSSNFYSSIMQVVIQSGIAPGVELSTSPTILWNTHKGRRQFGFADLPFKLSYQLYEGTLDSWIPSVKFSTHINFPIGKYNNLDINNQGTDTLGSGSWFPSVGISTSAIKRIGKSICYLSYRFETSYAIGTSSYVNGRNVYGGGIGTKGWVYPGNIFHIGGSLEGNISQNWALAIDFVYNHFNKTRFSGKTLIPNTSPSAEQISIAPAIEYNWSANVGIIAGSWFTILGRNTAYFNSAVISINIYN